MKTFLFLAPVALLFGLASGAAWWAASHVPTLKATLTFLAFWGLIVALIRLLWCAGSCFSRKARL